MKTFVYSNLLPKVLKRPPNSIPVPFIDSEKLAKRDGHKDPHLSSAFKARLFCGFSQWKPEFWHRNQNLTLKAFEAIKKVQRLKGNFHTSQWLAVIILVEPLILSKIWILAPKTAKKLYSLRSQFSKMRQFPGFFQHCDVSIVVNSEVSNRAFNTIDADDTQVVLFFFAPQKERIMKEIQCQLCDKCWWTTPYNSLHLCDAFQGFKGVQKQPFKHEKINWYTTF